MVICYPHKVERPVAAHTILTEQYKQIKKCIISGAIVSVLSNHFDPGSGAKYCDQGVCMSLCFVRLFARIRSHISKTTRPNFTKFSVHVTCGRGSISSDGNAIRCVLPVLWLTSCFHII